MGFSRSIDTTLNGTQHNSLSILMCQTKDVGIHVPVIDFSPRNIVLGKAKLILANVCSHRLWQLRTLDQWICSWVSESYLSGFVRDQ